MLDCKRVDVKGTDTTETGLNETKIEAAATGEQTGKSEVVIFLHLGALAHTSTEARIEHRTSNHDIAENKCCQMKGLDITEVVTRVFISAFQLGRIVHTAFIRMDSISV